MTNIKERTLIKELMWNTMFEIVFYDMKEVTIAIINDCYRTNYNVNNYRNRSNTPIKREDWVNLSTNEYYMKM